MYMQVVVMADDDDDKWCFLLAELLKPRFESCYLSMMHRKLHSLFGVAAPVSCLFSYFMVDFVFPD